MSRERATIELGFIGPLTIVFITLKLCGIIAWSWVWVLSPLWIIPAALLTFCAACFATVGLIMAGEFVWSCFRK